MERGTHKRLLGEVLVGEGILTDAQLAAALAEQRTGQQLGAIFVSSGVLSGPSLAMALADQFGGPLQTEHTWATGWSRPRPGIAAARAPRGGRAGRGAGGRRRLGISSASSMQSYESLRPALNVLIARSGFPGAARRNTASGPAVAQGERASVSSFA